MVIGQTQLRTLQHCTHLELCTSKLAIIMLGPEFKFHGMLVCIFGSVVYWISRCIGRPSARSIQDQSSKRIERLVKAYRFWHA
jgi:hypothetical protein